MTFTWIRDKSSGMPAPAPTSVTCMNGYPANWPQTANARTATTVNQFWQMFLTTVQLHLFCISYIFNTWKVVLLCVRQVHV